MSSKGKWCLAALVALAAGAPRALADDAEAATAPAVCCRGFVVGGGLGVAMASTTGGRVDARVGFDLDENWALSADGLLAAFGAVEWGLFAKAQLRLTPSLFVRAGVGGMTQSPYQAGEAGLALSLEAGYEWPVGSHLGLALVLGGASTVVPNDEVGVVSLGLALTWYQAVRGPHPAVEP